MALVASLRLCPRPTLVSCSNSLRVCHRAVSSVPQAILDQLDQKKPLANSVNLYSRHFSVSTGEYNWPATIKEDVNNPRFRLSQFVMDWARSMKPSKHVIYTKSSHRSKLPCVHVYPDNVKITFNSSTLEEVERFQSAWMFGNDQDLDFLTIEKLTKNTVHIYVCCHEARDQRCGVIGELLISGLREYVTAPPTDVAGSLQQLDIQVFGCSHIGGHKFAGNMVVYKPDWKQGIWYGRVLPEDIDNVMRETVINGKVIGRHWRGGLPDGSWDPKEHMTAEDAEERSIECACMS